ncbi:MAG: M48 family metallopeptidase [bacterium]|nr:M48 family metallopeptidase [bacterium]
MEKETLINNQKIFYTLLKSRKAKRLRITIYPDAKMTVSLPFHMNESAAEKFMREKSRWIIRKLNHAKNFASRYNPLLHNRGKNDYNKNKRTAFVFIDEKLKFFNQFYQFSYSKISIRNQKTRWGSCSREGTLNFNYKIIRLPEKFADYIIVHELCHLKELNHSSRFWDLVARAVPDYREVKRELRKV